MFGNEWPILSRIVAIPHIQALDLHIDDLAADYRGGDVKTRMRASDTLKKLEAMGRKARDILSGAYRVAAPDPSDQAALKKQTADAKAKQKADHADKGRVA